MTTFAPFQIWQLRPSEEGGPLFLSAARTKEDQEQDMTHWVRRLPDALLVYRTRHASGVSQELHLDRTLATLPKPRKENHTR